MWSPTNPTSDENQIPLGQNVHRKSVGRTPLKVLAGQQLAVLDPNTLVDRRPSLSKASSHSALMSKESVRVGAGTPVSVWIDTCHNYCLKESSETEANTSKNLPTFSFSETEVSEEDSLNLSAGPDNRDQINQSCVAAILSPPIDTFNSQAASSDNEDKYRHAVNKVAHSLHTKCNKLISSSSAIATHELPALETSLTLEGDTCQKAKLMSHEPESHDDAHCVLIPGSPRKHITEPDKIQLENINTTDEDGFAANVWCSNDVYIGKPETVLPSMRDEGHLEDLLFTDEDFDGVEVVSKPNAIVSANDTYEIDPHLNLASKQIPYTIDVISEVMEVIGKWNLSVTDNDDYLHNRPANDEGNVEGCPPLEILSSPPGTVTDDLKETQLLSGSLEKLDPVVRDNSGRSFPDTLLHEDSLLKEAVFDPEMSSCRTENYKPETSANIFCTPVDGVTTDHVLSEGDSTQLIHTKWFSPISNMDQVHPSNPSRDQGNVMENTPFTENCPTPILPNHSKLDEILLLNKKIFKSLTPRFFARSHESGTSMTPVSTTEGVTWTTPIMLLNKSMNTSGEFMGKGEKSAKDTASETDSVLWNFSREALSDASRNELMDRLEGTLIVVEVLSRQLQGWQQNNVSSKPSEQRECATQTRVTCTSTDEQYYHNLYLQTLRRLQSLQHSKEQEETLHMHLKEATEALTTQKNEASSMIEFAKNLYEITQKNKTDLQQKMSHTHKLLADHMSVLEKMSEKLKDSLLQREEMRASMEKALQAKDAAEQCLQDLEIHSSAVITQLRRDGESERQLCEAVKEAYKQQHAYNEELAGFVHRAQDVCSEVKEDRTQLQRQCSLARELMSRHWHLFEVMKEKSQSAFEEYEGIKMERDLAVLENEKVYSHLKSIKSQNEQMKLKNSRLGSELELLMERLCTLESDNEQLKEENSELEELLSAKDSSMKLLEKELNEATARGLEYQDRIKHLDGQVVPSLEMDLIKALNQKQALQKQLDMLAKEHASQVTYYTESLEFLEQENSVCREQVTETETQLKTHHRTVLDRNYQCENLKDTIKALQKETNDLQEKLSHSQEEAQSRILKLSKEISDSSTEVSKIKSHMLELIDNLKENTKTEAIECLPGSQTPGQSLVTSKEEEQTTTKIHTTDCEDQREGIWSKTSAFTVVLPVTSPSADTPQEHLTDVVQELSHIVADVITTSSNAMEEKGQIIQDFKMEIASLKEELQSQKFQHTSEIRVLQDELSNLKRRNCVMDEKINSKEKCISELQEILNQQEQKILQQFSKAKESEVLIQENAELQLSLKVCEKEVEVLKQELAQNSTEAARNWIQEKLLLHKDLTTLRLKLADTEYSKSEAIQRLLRHKDILKANLTFSEAEVRKLDDVIVRIRQVLLSIPDVVNDCEKLRQLMEFLN